MKTVAWLVTYPNGESFASTEARVAAHHRKPTSYRKANKVTPLVRRDPKAEALVESVIDFAKDNSHWSQSDFADTMDEDFAEKLFALLASRRVKR